MNCKRCGKELCKKNQSGYCSTCIVLQRREEKLNTWLNSGNTGMSVDTTIRGVIREYILDQQGHKCAICGIPDIWNNQELHFVLDHIDGNAANSTKDNLRLICPNCDSQLPTFKSRNKNSARNLRKQFLKETVPRKGKSTDKEKS